MSNKSPIKECRSRIEPIESRILLSASVAATVEGYPRAIQMTEEFTYFGEDPELNNLVDFSAIKRYSFESKTTQSISPAKGSKWDLSKLHYIRAAGDRAWFVFSTPMQVWTISDNDDVPTRIDLDDDSELDFHPEGDGETSVAVSPDGRNLYIASHVGESHRAWICNSSSGRSLQLQLVHRRRHMSFCPRLRVSWSTFLSL